MSTPGAEDASPSPEYNGDPDDGSDMAEQRGESQPEDGSPSQKATTAKANAKDPLRPRRKKARRACFACQRAHLTCGDERPCMRCIKRGLQNGCMDGVRKKAKYLHDAPDAALQPGVGGHYPHMNGNHHGTLPGQDLGAVALPQQGAFYTQAPSATYYSQNPGHAQVPVSAQDVSPAGPYSNSQTPISPQYNQAHQARLGHVPNTVSQGGPTQVQQFGGPLPFDPSDPAIFNFDISGLNFGNHYGALEMSMLGHMSSGAGEARPGEHNVMNPLDQAANMYNQQMPYSEAPQMATAITYEQNGLPRQDWQNAHSRQGSLQMPTQTPHNTPITAHIEQVHRQEAMLGPSAFTIAQGPSSLSSASPASTDVNAAYDTDNTLSANSLFPNSGQHQPHPNHIQQENRFPNTALQPIPSNVIRKRTRRDTKWIYEGIKKPYDYVGAFHRMRQFFERRYPKAVVEQIRLSMAKYRPALITAAGGLQLGDLIHQEQALQLSLIQIEESFSEVGVPSIVCRRSGEVVWVNKEFCFLTGWKPDILLGRQPNLNANTGVSQTPSSETSTPIITSQQDTPNQLNPVLIMELMDERSAVEYLDDFAEAAYLNSRGTPRRRVNMLKYQTKEDMANLQASEASRRDRLGSSNKVYNGDSIIKLEGGPVNRESSARVPDRDGRVDCMIQWHVKRDNFDMPMLVCMHILPVMDFAPVRPLLDRC